MHKSCAEHATTVGFRTRSLDALEQLPNKTIALAVTNLGLKGRGFALLASCACRRGSGSVAASFILTYLEIAYEPPGESALPANSEATILAAEALNQIRTRVPGFVEDVLTFLSDVAPVHKREEDSAWCAMRLAAASICVPNIVFQRIHLIMATEARTPATEENEKGNFAPVSERTSWRCCHQKFLGTMSGVSI